MKRDSLKSILVITVICLIIATVMSAVNAVTEPLIKAENERAEKEALREVLPIAQDFDKLQIELPEKTGVSAVYRDIGGNGYAVMLRAKGYDGSKPMVIAIGVGLDGKITKCHVVSCAGETAGIGSKVSNDFFLSQFVEEDASLDGVDTISGATISSKAFVQAVREAMKIVGEVRDSEVAAND